MSWTSCIIVPLRWTVDSFTEQSSSEIVGVVVCTVSVYGQLYPKSRKIQRVSGKREPNG
jgi:hypothetical protein